MSSSTVLLTGANGFVAVHILDVLFKKGYNVVGTVRSESKTTYLKERYSNYSDKLSFAVVGDITAPGAFDQVIKDHKFDYVLHTSSPYTYSVEDVDAELYQPALHGTTEILKSVHSYGPTVKRVIVLSSFVAMFDLSKGAWPGHQYDENDWNPMDEETGKSNGVIGYFVSKRLAEKAAWAFVEKEKPSFTLTTLNPPYIYGPPDQEVHSVKKLNTSVKEIYEVLSQAGDAPAGLWVDVRDIALAHVLAIETPEAANQRFLISGGSFSPQHIYDFIYKKYPKRAEEAGVKKGTPGEYPPVDALMQGNNSKSREVLGLTYTSFEQCFTDMFDRIDQLDAESK